MKHVLLAVLLVAASPAMAFITKNDLVVTPTGQTTFHIAYRGQAGAPAFWCAAGDYVVRKLGFSNATRIYRTSSVPRRSGHGIDFSLSPQGAKPSGLLILSRDKGVSAGHARALCNARHLRK